MANLLPSELGTRAFWALILFAAIALAAVAVCPLVGGSGLDYEKLMRKERPDWNIFLQLRLPRALLALLTGASLAVSGTLFQALLRDALATPSNLGVSAAASLGAVIAITTTVDRERSFPVVWLFALIGAAAVIVLVVLLAQTNKRFSSLT